MTSTIVANGSFLDLSGIISFDTIEVQGTTANTDLILTASATLNNSGTILLDGADSRIYGNNNAANTLDNVNGTIEGAGQIGINNGGLNLTLINRTAGTIDANSTAALVLGLSGSPAASNAGLIEATNTGGLLIQDAVIDNFIGTQAGTIAATGAGAVVTLQNSDVAGGTLTTSSGGVIDTAGGSSNTIDGSVTPVTITTGSTVQVTDNSALFLSGAIGNSGTILDATTGDSTDIRINAGDPATLSGGGVVDLAGPNARIFGSSSTPATLDNVDNTIEGAGQIGINNGGLQLTLINEASGTIAANATSALVLGLSGSPAALNAGLIEALGTSELAIQDGAITNIIGTSEGAIAAVGTSAVVSLQNADVIGGTLESSGGGVIATGASTSNRLDGSTTPITITADSTVQVTDNSVLFLSGAIGNSGTILNATTGDSTDIQINGADTATLSGGGVVDLAGANARVFGTSSTVATLDNVDNTIEGAGQIGINNSGLALAVVNEASGTIDANGTASLVIQLGGPTLGNDGLIEDTGTGGLVVNATEIDNTGGGTVLANGAGAFVQLSNGILLGGTLTTSNGGVIATAGGTPSNTLDGSVTPVTITTGSTVQVTDNSELFLSGAIGNSGTILDATTGDSTDIRINAGDTATLSGGGVVELAGPNARIFGTSSTAATLDNVDNTIEGAGQIGINNSGLALALINEAGGTIAANAASALVLGLAGSPAVLNAGLIEALGTSELAIQNGAITNIIGTSEGAIAAVGTSAVVSLQNADVIGGTLESSGGGVIATGASTSNRLDGSTTPITITADSTVQVTDNSVLFLSGAIGNSGTILNATTGDSTDIQINAGDTATLSGGGVVDLAGANARVFGTSSTVATLDNVDNTIEGAGQIGINNSGLALAVVNEASGTIDANGTASLIIQLGGPTLGNDGLIEDTGTGGLVVNATEIDNTGGGTVLANGAGAFVQLSNGILLGGTLTTSNGGVIDTAAGTGSNTLDGSVTPVTITTGSTVQLTDNSQLFLSGAIGNSGTILDATTGDSTDIRINAGDTATLSGGGVVDLAGPNARIFGPSSIAATLDNVDNTIEGAGQIGVDNSGLALALINEAGGTIDASSTNTLFIEPGGPAVSNAGLMEGTGSGGLRVLDTGITNTGTVQALDGSSVTFDTSVTTTNNSGGTLTGGTWAAFSTGDGAHVDITGGAIAVDSAAIILSGDGATFDAFNGSTYEAIEQSLTSIAAGGTLEVLADRDYATANTITDSGLITLGGGSFVSPSLDITATGTLAGFGTVTDPLNDGTIEATTSAATLLITSPITGTGELLVDPGATLELGSSVASTETLVVDPTGTVKIDDPSGFATGTVSSLDPGATFDFGTTLVTAAGIVGDSLEITLAGGTTLDYTLVSPDPLDRTAIIRNGQSGDNVVVYREAQGTISPNPVTIANQHVSGTLNGNAAPITAALTISNTDPADGFSEHLDASLSTAPNAVGGGSFSGLAAGGTNDTSLLLGVSNAVAGAISGTGVVTLSTDGTGVDGNRPLVLGTQDIPVSGNVFNYATASAAAPNPIALGQHHVGDTVTQHLTIANTATNDGFSENLDAGFTAESAGITTGGTVSELAAGSSSAALRATIDLASAGSFTGSATIAAVSDGSFAGLGTTALASQTIDVSGEVFRLAEASLTPPDDFGIHHVGDTVAQAITIANTASADGFSENLDATAGAAGSGFTLSGSADGIAAGQSSTALSATLDTATAGIFSSNGTIGLTSDGTGVDTLGTTALPDGAIALSGTVLNFATAAFEELSGGGTLTQNGNDYTLDLGTFAHDGASATVDLGVLNSAIGPADTLKGSFDLSGSGYGTAGFSAFSGITAGQSTDVGTVTFDPSSFGTFFETITLDPTGFDAAPFSGPLAPETFLVEAEVPCFARGTRIATPDGAVPVEDLRVGDAVIADSGEALPIVWLGHRRVDCRRHPRPELVWPVRVEANAFAAGAPARDLWLSPDHAVFVDGVLIPIKHLINGATIAQVPSDEVTYWHVELPRHSVLLAEGLPAESYLDTGNRAQFVGGAAHLALHPDFTALGWDDACAPLCVDGPTLPAVKRRLIARLAQLGYRRMAAPDLHLVARGRSIRAAAVKGRLHYFMLPSGTAEVRIVSRSGVPAGEDFAVSDCRRLGARIGGILVDGKPFALDGPALGDGFYAREHKGAEAWRWTDGAALLRLPEPKPRSSWLELLVLETMPGWERAAPEPSRVAA